MKSVEIKFQSSAPVQGILILPTRSHGVDFKQLKDSLRSSGDGLYSDIQRLQQQVMSGKSLSSQELITYQIKAHQFGLQVELVSKVAESAVSSLKRLQNPQ